MNRLLLDKTQVAEDWRTLHVGDRIRLVRMPPEWDLPGSRVPPCTRRLVHRLIARRRSLRVYEVDECGAPWVRCRLRRKSGAWEHHYLSMTQGGWVRVKARRTWEDSP
jgi:hypothetical protein